ncbi:V-type ATP synthase subunit I [Anaeromicrobium sediminis]|uniref:SHOCT domain-containing protein n=1 Tax=Anaeromicrobium sediminis TaxID=1478221 RepID=A0A267MN55_9FIRM|nr:hypothetical protein [Anaeromicrobium sediminis]PAB60305.1 hypothetical protein CCE28_05250 [Anaeromicrobium sediminis]
MKKFIGIALIGTMLLSTGASFADNTEAIKKEGLKKRPGIVKEFDKEKAVERIEKLQEEGKITAEQAKEMMDRVDEREYLGEDFRELSMEEKIERVKDLVDEGKIDEDRYDDIVKRIEQMEELKGLKDLSKEEREEKIQELIDEGKLDEDFVEKLKERKGGHRGHGGNGKRHEEFGEDFRKLSKEEKIERIKDLVDEGKIDADKYDDIVKRIEQMEELKGLKDLSEEERKEKIQELIDEGKLDEDFVKKFKEGKGGHRGHEKRPGALGEDFRELSKEEKIEKINDLVEEGKLDQERAEKMIQAIEEGKTFEKGQRGQRRAQ